MHASSPRPTASSKFPDTTLMQTKPLIAALPGNENLTARLADLLGAEVARLEHRRFPDGESYVRLHADPKDRELLLVATLDRPDDKVPTLLFAADLAHDLGAARVGLVIPYLPYMRQDQRFAPGEALTSKTFARWLSLHFDWLVTVDPHLHRYASLDEIYSLQSRVVAAAPAVAEWIAREVDDPVLIGPDGESEQWVGEVAFLQDLPWRVMSKKRYGDRDVRMQLPDLGGLESHTPVLVDDIISSGTTMARAARHLIDAGFRPPLAVGVHGLFGEQAREVMVAGGIERIVCTDTVNAPEARIDLAPLLTDAIKRLLQPRP
jgi:ribose-phosphate pyrophosphokinase